MRQQRQHSFITSLTNDSCIAPPFVRTRLTGSASIDTAVLDSTTMTSTYGNLVGPGINVCINGNCSLPGEQIVLNACCYNAVSVFTVDYDAPLGKAQSDIRKNLERLVKYQDKGFKKRGLSSKS